MKLKRLLLIGITTILVTSVTEAVEFLITDQNGIALNDTTNKLNLGDSASPKTVKLWLTYNTTELNAANMSGGLFSGGARFTPQNSQVATVARGAGQVVNPSSQWNPFTVTYLPISPTSYPTAMQVEFSRLNGQSGLTLPATMQFLLAEIVISPGPSMNSTGTQFTVVVPLSQAPIIYGTAGSQQVFGTQPLNYTFTVVPEPTTIALGAVATAMLGGVGFYRRKKAVKSS